MRRAAGRAKVAALVLAAAGLVCCGGGTSPTSSSSGPIAVNNTQPIAVNFGPANNTVNGLYTSVTVCVPGTTQCQTIGDVQVDTGSVGLRLFSSQLALALPPVAGADGTALDTCISFADKSYLWGSVASADIALAGEKASGVPVELMGSPGLAPVPSVCSNGGTSADDVASLGANGILGIGVFRQDCGQACSDPSPPPLYFTCPGGSCAVTPVGLNQQLQNPVWLFPQDNNGFLISLPTVSSGGAPGVSGSLIFGIGTQANNSLGSAQVYATDDVGNFTTTFQGKAYSSSYIDTGSNGFFFLDASTIGLPPCPSPNDSFSCPPQSVTYSAANTGANGVSGQLTFSVANANQLFSTNNSALDDLAGPDTGDFDWGLPFFYGRNVFIGIEGQSSAAGVGPYWAY